MSVLPACASVTSRSRLVSPLPIRNTAPGARSRRSVSGSYGLPAAASPGGKLPSASTTRRAVQIAAVRSAAGDSRSSAGSRSIMSAAMVSMPGVLRQQILQVIAVDAARREIGRRRPGVARLEPVVKMRRPIGKSAHPAGADIEQMRIGPACHKRRPRPGDRRRSINAIFNPASAAARLTATIVPQNPAPMMATS